MIPGVSKTMMLTLLWSVINLYTILVFHRDLVVLNAMTMLSQKTFEVLFTTMTHLEVQTT